MTYWTTRQISLLPCLMVATVTLGAKSATVPVSQFARTGLSGWESRVFDGATRYRLVEVNGRTALEASADDTASVVARKLSVNLSETPWLHWSWRVSDTFGDIDERSRAGDDYPARVYVVFSTGVGFWNTRALNYVWSSNQPVGTAWVNAFTNNAMMLAVQSGDEAVGRWVTERRNVYADYRRLFGEAPPKTTAAVAIMTDADNSGLSATAWYADLRFESADADRGPEPRPR